MGKINVTSGSVTRLKRIVELRSEIAGAAVKLNNAALMHKTARQEYDSAISNLLTEIDDERPLLDANPPDVNEELDRR